MDRRSLKRLLVRLANEKQIKSIRTVLRCGDKERTLHFICQPSITMENSVIRSAIEQAKLKLFCVSKSGLTRYSFKNNQQSDPSAAGFVALPDNLKPGPSLTQSVKEAKEQLKQKKWAKLFELKVDSFELKLNFWIPQASGEDGPQLEQRADLRRRTQMRAGA